MTTAFYPTPKGVSTKAWVYDSARRPSPRRFGEWVWDTDAGKWECVLNDRGKAALAQFMEDYDFCLTKVLRSMPRTRKALLHALASGYCPDEIEAVAQMNICHAFARHRFDIDGKPIKIITSVGLWLLKGISDILRRRAGQPGLWGIKSLDQKCGSPNGSTGRMADFIADPATVPETGCDCNPEHVALIRHAARFLCGREKRLFTAYHSSPETTLADIAAAEGVTRERIRQIVKRATDKVRARMERADPALYWEMVNTYSTED